jgi:hypothetical protein
MSLLLLLRASAAVDTRSGTGSIEATATLTGAGDRVDARSGTGSISATGTLAGVGHGPNVEQPAAPFARTFILPPYVPPARPVDKRSGSGSIAAYVAFTAHGTRSRSRRQVLDEDFILTAVV